MAFCNAIAFFETLILMDKWMGLHQRIIDQNSTVAQNDTSTCTHCKTESPHSLKYLYILSYLLSAQKIFRRLLRSPFFTSDQIFVFEYLFIFINSLIKCCQLCF